MKKLFIVLAVISFSFNAFAFDKVFEGTIEELEELTIKENGIKINNFAFAEKPAVLAKGFTNIVVSFSVRNKNDSAKHLSAMIVGKSDNNILWAICVEPIISTISANGNEIAKNDAYVSPGILNQTKSIWLRIVGDF